MKKKVMINELSKTQRILFLIAVMFTNINVAADGPIYNIAEPLYAHYSIGQANWIMSGACFTMMLGSFAAPFIIRKLGKRNALLLSTGIFTLSAIALLMSQKGIWLVAMRSCIGFSQGITNVVALALITEVFVEESERARYIGFFNASMNVVYGTVAIVSGMLVDRVGWFHAFDVYYAAIPMLILVILFIPNIESSQEQDTVKETGGVANEKEKIGFDFWALYLLALVFFTTAMIFGYFKTVYNAEFQICSVTEIGIQSTVGQIASVVAGLVFGFVFMKTRRYLISICYLILAGCLLMCGMWHTMTMFWVQIIVQNIAYGLAFSALYSVVPEIIPASKLEFGMSLITIAYSFGGFIATYFVTFVMSVFRTESLCPVLIFSAGIMAVVTVLEFFFAVKSRKKQGM